MIVTYSACVLAELTERGFVCMPMQILLQKDVACKDTSTIKHELDRFIEEVKLLQKPAIVSYDQSYHDRSRKLRGFDAGAAQQFKVNAELLPPDKVFRKPIAA